MAVGKSGRIVVLLDDERQKTDLYVRLAAEKRTVKEWLSKQIDRYLKEAKRKR